MASCGCQTRCALLCQCVKLAGDLNDDAFAITADVGEAPGEANPRGSRALGKQANSRRGHVIQRVHAFTGSGRLRQVWGLTHAESGRAPATTCFLLLPPASPAFTPRAGKQKRPRRAALIRLKSLRDLGVGEGIRTLDPNLGKVEPIDRAGQGFMRRAWEYVARSVARMVGCAPPRPTTRPCPLSSSVATIVGCRPP
jgi:hypothetical protein